MSYLLDTHAIIWLTGRARPVPDEVLGALNDDDVDVVFASAVSAFEVATKVRSGKLAEARELSDRWLPSIRELGATPLPLRAEHALTAGSLDWEHRDPFDRLLVAQAVTEGLRLVSADRAILAAKGLDVLAWH